jgi:TIR domain
MPKIFLSYRRQDSAGVAGRIYNRLRAHFGDDSIFMGIDSIPFGLDFREHLSSAIDQCSILLAVIGPRWTGEAGAARRIDDPRDFVRIEVESALERNLPVVPILIDRAPMPAETDLPPSLARLPYRNALELDQGRDFHPHVDRLIEGIAWSGPHRRSAWWISCCSESVPKGHCAPSGLPRLTLRVFPAHIAIGCMCWFVCSCLVASSRCEKSRQ